MEVSETILRVTSLYEAFLFFMKNIQVNQIILSFGYNPYDNFIFSYDRGHLYFKNEHSEEEKSMITYEEIENAIHDALEDDEVIVLYCEEIASMR